MKRNKTIRLCLTLALLLAILPQACQAACAEQDLSLGHITRRTGDMAYRTPSQPMEILTSSEADDLNAQMSQYEGQAESFLINKASNFYYYNNLEPVAKEIYDVMYGVARDPESEGNIGLMMTVIDPQSDEFYYAFNVAYRAICFDHPELFWLYSGQEAELGYASEAISQNGFYFVYIKMMKPFAEFRSRMTAFNEAAAAFLADIDTGISEYATVRQIHDKLIDLVTYNTPVAEQILLLQRGQDLAHTAYGALVSDSSGNPHLAVCDGYSLAFEYLLQQCGIDTIFMAGLAGSDEDSAGGHAWNLVKVDGIWYEVDATWDDWGNVEKDLMPGTNLYRAVTEALSDAAYREKVEHFLFMISTEQMRSFDPGDEYDYVTRDGSMMYQFIQKSVHIRMPFGDDSTDPDPAIIRLAPVAMRNYPKNG